MPITTNDNPEKSQLRNRLGILPVQHDNSALPWVCQVKHLQVDDSMKLDTGNKRRKLIGKVTSVLQEYHFVNPEIVTKIMISNIFTTSLYISNLCDILSQKYERLYNTWNVPIRKVYSVNSCAHIYLIEVLSMYPKTMLGPRYVAYCRSLGCLFITLYNLLYPPPCYNLS